MENEGLSTEKMGISRDSTRRVPWSDLPAPLLLNVNIFLTFGLMNESQKYHPQKTCGFVQVDKIFKQKPV